MTDVNRRKLLKGIGVAAGTSAFGFGSAQADGGDVSESEVEAALETEEIAVALETAGLRVESLQTGDATGQTVNRSLWLEVPVAGDAAEYLAYNDENSIAEIKLDETELVRTESRDDGVFVERLRMGEAVTAEALRALEATRDWEQALESGNVDSVNVDEAAAHVDETSGVRRVFVPAELGDGTETLLMAEISADGGLASVYSFSGGSDGPTTTESAIDCWANCITWGTFCSTPCSVCVGAPSAPTCSPCAVCIGGTATVCAGKCGIEQFW
ncbi:hypothetical protein [Halorussus halobius]|uniref:hypothetical protein n=1 Tax=Halorussus halobius TaxID=1710537 RepID=UPI001B2FF078|nr:hypothetical protein [Halorussus halobius]